MNPNSEMKLEFVDNGHSGRVGTTGLIVTTPDDTLSILPDEGNPGFFLITLNGDIMGGIGDYNANDDETDIEECPDHGSQLAQSGACVACMNETGDSYAYRTDRETAGGEQDETDVCGQCGAEPGNPDMTCDTCLGSESQYVTGEMEDNGTYNISNGIPGY